MVQSILRDAKSNGAHPAPLASDAAGTGLHRIKSQDLFRQAREVEIDHDGRIYRLRLTQLNKLILNA